MKFQPKIYCACSKTNLPKKQLINQENILVNAINLTEQEKNFYLQQNFILDNIGNNISYLNYTFCELTSHYWIWKNSDENFVGTCHYRRFWNYNDLLNLNEKTIYVAQRSSLDNRSIINHFEKCHGKYGIQTINNLIDKQKIRILSEHFSNLNNFDTLFPCNMLVCHKYLYDKICEILFETLFEIFKESIEYIGTLDNYQRKYVAFIAERILTCIYIHNEYFLGKTDIKECRYELL